MMQNIVVLLWNLFIWYTVSGEYLTSTSVLIARHPNHYISSFTTIGCHQSRKMVRRIGGVSQYQIVLTLNLETKNILFENKCKIK